MSEMTRENRLAELIQKDQFIGWTCQIDYEQAIVFTSDQWKAHAQGVPHNCFLLATLLNPENPAENAEAAREIVLLRVIGSASLTSEDKSVQSRIAELKRRASEAAGAAGDESQFSGLRCRILGTFYTQDGKLRLGSDIESYQNAVPLDVYRPTGTALEAIVNYMSPERAAAAAAEARRLGLKAGMPRFPVGTVRYASTDRLHRGNASEQAAFNLNAIDFLSRRTAILGMTRTGKSNTVKQLVSVVMRTSSECALKIGQIIYDLNGEYANANLQDKGSIAEVYPDDTIRYRMIPTEGFELMLNNFFIQISEGHATLRGLIETQQSSPLRRPRRLFEPGL